MEHTTVNRRYRVDRRIGEGGMAEVYLGHDLLLNRAVAIKALRRQHAADPSFRARFEREAQSAAGFTHPNIIDIYDVGEERGTPYIVMEYVNGETLKEIIENEGPFDPDDVAALLEQVSAALDYAHERGLVHRDVKPQNMLVDADGLAKVVDFGIAKSVVDGDLTEVGTGLGTVHYISPEQASGLMATPSSDIYSLGVVAFEMLTKRLPFDADTAVGVAIRHVHDAPPPPSSLNPAVPRGVDAIVLRALAKDPTRRFATAGALAQAMTDWQAYGPASKSGSRSHAAAPTQVTRTGMAAPTMSPPASKAPSRSTGEPSRSRPAPAAISPRQPVPQETRDQIGCVTWLVGSVILIGLIALIWFGYRYSPLLADLGSSTEDPTATVAVYETDPIAEMPTPTQPAPTVPAEQTPEVAQVAVPNVVGMSIDQARTEVTDRGLLLELGDPVFDDGVEAGAISEQDPPAGMEVAQGSEVLVKPSQGSATVDLLALSLVGQDPDEAEQALRGRGLNVQREDIPSTDVDEGRVAGHSPERSVTVGQTVTLFVSVGDMVQIPVALFGQSLDRVVSQLEELGLSVTNQVGVDGATISAQVDMDDAGIEDRDVVGVQNREGTAAFGAWVEPGTELTVVFYDRELDSP